MSCHIPGNVSTYNEEMAPLIERARQAYVPVDVKAELNKLLELMDNDKLDECIEAGEELLKERIPDTTRTRVHILIASCLADPDEMEEHYEKALDIWTLLNSQQGKNTRYEPFLRKVRAQLDALAEAIQEERNDDAASDAAEDEDDVESDPTLDPPITSTDRPSSHDSTSERSHATPTLYTGASPSRSSASSNASLVLGATTSSRLFGAVALPGQQTSRLHDRLGMSPLDILKLA